MEVLALSDLRTSSLGQHIYTSRAPISVRKAALVEHAYPFRSTDIASRESFTDALGSKTLSPAFASLPDGIAKFPLGMVSTVWVILLGRLYAIWVVSFRGLFYGCWKCVPEGGLALPKGIGFLLLGVGILFLTTMLVVILALELTLLVTNSSIFLIRRLLGFVSNL